MLIGGGFKGGSFHGSQPRCVVMFGDNVKYLKLAIKRNCGSTNQAPKIYLLSYLNVHFMNNSSRSFHTPPDSHLIENRKKKQKDKHIKLSHKIITAKRHRLVVLKPRPHDGATLGWNVRFSGFVRDGARFRPCMCSGIITTTTTTNTACVQKLSFISLKTIK